MIAHVFPGQGAQYVGMAGEFAAESHAARTRLEQADDLLHIPLSRVMLEGPEEVLRQTDYTQPAIFLHSLIAYELDTERQPAGAMAGHSLGEYSALCASGAVSFESALELVHVRGTLMAEAGRREPGTMAAIIGMEEAALFSLCQEVEEGTGKIVRPANLNSPGQIVISGSVEGVHDAMRIAKERGVRMAKELAVSGAFHSPLMQYAADGLRERLASTMFVTPPTPVYSNVTAEPVTSPEEIRQLLVEQLTAPVRWEPSVRNMYAAGAREFVEYGPGKVLQGLIGRTVSDVKTSGFEKPRA